MKLDSRYIRGVRAWAALLAALSGACFPSFPPLAGDHDSGVADTGAEDAGERRDATAVDGEVPLAPITSLARGISEAHTCARRQDQTLLCWGENSEGQLARGETMVPRPIDFDLGVFDEIAVGAAHTCLRAGRFIRCFGRNDHRQLGNGSTAPFESVPITIAEIDDALAISAGYAYTCAIRASGTIACWGGMIIVGGGEPTPQEVGPFPSRPVSVATGAETAAAILENGELWTWGRGGCNRHGVGTDEHQDQPVHVTALPAGRVVDVAIGDLHGCAVIDSGDVYCWGCNGVGQIGTGTTTAANIGLHPPVRVLQGAIEIDASFRNTCALMEDRSVRCWGANDFGLIGNGVQLPADVEPSPVAVAGLGGVQQLEVYFQHACALLENGAGVACWGYGKQGQIGDGGKIDTSFPILIAR